MAWMVFDHVSQYILKCKEYRYIEIDNMKKDVFSDEAVNALADFIELPPALMMTRITGKRPSPLAGYSMSESS